jgi:NAD-reducing hydrogenase small subunit
MRNGIPVIKLLQRVYVEGADEGKVIPTDGVPSLLKHARPVHEFVKVDLYVPGCPPPTKAIFNVITDLLEGRTPEANPKVKFG